MSATRRPLHSIRRVVRRRPSRRRNLHAVDVAAIPNRLEDTVAETKRPKCFGRFLAHSDRYDRSVLVQDLLSAG